MHPGFLVLYFVALCFFGPFFFNARTTVVEHLGAIMSYFTAIVVLTSPLYLDPKHCVKSMSMWDLPVIVSALFFVGLGIWIHLNMIQRAIRQAQNNPR